MALLLAGCGGDTGADGAVADSAPDLDDENSATTANEVEGHAAENEDAAAGDDAEDDAGGAGGADPEAYGLDAGATVLGIGDSAQVQWQSGTTFEVTLHDFVATREIDLADFDGADFGAGADSYLVGLAEDSEPELETFFIADVTVVNTGPDVPLTDILTTFGVADAADLPSWSIWFAEGTDTPLDSTLAAGDTYSGRLVGDVYTGDHYILSFESSRETIWVVSAEEAQVQ